MSHAVIIPSRNADNVDYCVNALRVAGDTSRVIIVANGGIEKRRVDVEYIDYGTKPFVYARAVNLGVAAADVADVVVCGDDTRLLTPSGYGHVFELMRRTGRLCVGSAAFTGAVGNVNQQWCRTGLTRIERRMLCFIAVCIPRATWNTVGPMDERLVGYGFDDDLWCYRARKHNVTMLIDDSCVVEHGVLPSEYRHYGGGDLSQNRIIYEEILANES